MRTDNEQSEFDTPAVDGSRPSIADSLVADDTADPNRKRSQPKRNRPRTGSKALIDTAGPDPGASLEDVKLAVGVIAGTHGVNGDLKLKLLTDHPEHLSTVSTVYLGDSDHATRLLGVRFHGNQALITLDGVSTPEAGKLLGGLKVRIAGSDVHPLEEGEYFLFQLIGLKAITAQTVDIGIVSDIIETGAHDVLVITPNAGPDILVPNHPQYVHEITPEQGRIVIELPVYGS
jgi:16S rRNA processing protein RimM